MGLIIPAVANIFEKFALKRSCGDKDMVDRASYKSIRDQLISLSVDIEDKAKICSLLERKIENERSLLGKVEGSINEEYDSILEVWKDFARSFIMPVFYNCYNIARLRPKSEHTKRAQDRKLQLPIRLVQECPSLPDLISLLSQFEPFYSL